jgi:hypothetical protein
VPVNLLHIFFKCGRTKLKEYFIGYRYCKDKKMPGSPGKNGFDFYMKVETNFKEKYQQL